MWCCQLIMITMLLSSDVACLFVVNQWQTLHVLLLAWLLILRVLLSVECDDTPGRYQSGASVGGVQGAPGGSEGALSLAQALPARLRP